jgi:hypothetical protein
MDPRGELSTHLRALFANAACGCLDLEAAQKLPAGEDRQVAIEGARAARANWGCPAGRAQRQPTAADRARLSPDHLEALDAIAELTGAAPPCTCPLWYLRTGAIATAAHVDACRESHCLTQCHGRRIPRVVMDAAHLVATGRARRDRYEARQREQQHEAARAVAEAPRQPR